MQKLLTQSEETIAWSNGNFVQPFLNTLDVELPFGATEYVGRSYSQRSTNSGAGGRTVTNLVLNTTSGRAAHRAGQRHGAAGQRTWAVISAIRWSSTMEPA